MSKKQHLSHDQKLKGFYAGFVSRMVAFVVDISILTIVVIIINWSIAAILDFFGLSLATIAFTKIANSAMTFRDYAANIIAVILVMAMPLITFSILVTYYVGSWVLMGQTIGKQFLGLKIVSIDGSHISFKQGIIRYFGYWLSAIPLFAGYWWVLLDDERRSWHDRLAHTCVIYVWDARTGPRLRALLQGKNQDQQSA